MLKENGVPLYYQIETILRQRILSGLLKERMPFPKEEVLQKEFNVSRITIRHALTSLDQEGFITRKRGKGTSVSARVPLIEPRKLTGSMESLMKMAINSRLKILEMGMIDPPQIVRQNLGIAEGKQVLRIRKIRFINESPFSYIINYLPEEIGVRISLAELEQDPSLLFDEKILGTCLVESIETIEASIADVEESDLLSIRLGDPLLKMQRTGFNINQKAIMHSFVLYRADKYSFTVRLKRQGLKKSSGWGMREEVISP